MDITCLSRWSPSRGPKKCSRLSGLHSSFPKWISPLVKLTEQTAEAKLKLKCHKQSHVGNQTGPQHTECALLCSLWGNKTCFKVPSTQKESTSWIPAVIMAIKASSKVLMLTGIHMQRALLLPLPQEALKNSRGWFLYLIPRWVGVY